MGPPALCARCCEERKPTLVPVIVAWPRRLCPGDGTECFQACYGSVGVPQLAIRGPQWGPFVPGRLEAGACPPGGSRLLYTAVPCPADSSFLLFCRTAVSHYFNPAVSAVFSESDGAFFVGPGHWGSLVVISASVSDFEVSKSLF